MTYLQNFKLPILKTNVSYPYNILAPMRLDSIEFDPVSIFYGSNGSGKSTLLNIIARKIAIDMKDRGNDSAYLQQLIDNCRAEFHWNFGDGLPIDSRFIRSEDVMHEIVRLRKKNETIKNHIKETSPKLYKRFFMGNPVERKKYVWSDDSWVFSALENFDSAMSNGELAFQYFENSIATESLIMLDEPENSLSPKFQRNLADMIHSYSRFFNCQFIIASHSPFMLSISGAKIYNLDEHPAKVSKWNELENMHIYIELFKRLINESNATPNPETI